MTHDDSADMTFGQRLRTAKRRTYAGTACRTAFGYTSGNSKMGVGQGVSGY